MFSVEAGQIYRHRNHNPAMGRWHEYKIIGIVKTGPGPQDSPDYFTAVHTETGKWHDILPGEGNKFWAFPEVDQLHVCYENIHNKKRWLRPIGMFMDGRFTLISDQPIATPAPTPNPPEA